MRTDLEGVSHENPQTSMVLYGSYLEKGDAANDIDLIVLVESKQEVENVKEGLRSLDWPASPDPEFFFREVFWDWVDNKDFKFSTAFDGDYEVYGSPVDENQLETILHERPPDEDDVRFNFYRSVDAWDKAHLFLEEAKNYSRREMTFDEDFDPQVVYEDLLNETLSDIVTDNLSKSAAALSISSGYLSGAQAYSEGDRKHTMQQALESPANEMDRLLSEVRDLNQQFKQEQYEVDYLEEYVGRLHSILESSPINNHFIA